MIDFRRIPAQNTYAFRQAILWPDKPLSHVMLKGDDDALHFGAYDADQLIGVATFFVASPKARLRKFAIAPAYRHRGLGSGLLMHGVRMLKRRGIAILWCDARQSAQAFYEKLGFETGDKVFFKAGVPYIVAQLSLSDILSSDRIEDVADGF